MRSQKQSWGRYDARTESNKLQGIQNDICGFEFSAPVARESFEAHPIARRLSDSLFAQWAADLPLDLVTDPARLLVAALHLQPTRILLLLMRLDREDRNQQ
jgi:hypothetical protein